MKENPDELDTEQFEIRTFTPYKDLEPYHEYNLDDIKAIHATILSCIKHLQTKYDANDDNIRTYNAKNRVGFSISNFLNTMNFENLLIKQQICLYLNYVAFFHISQQKQLKRLLTKLQEFDNDIEENLNVHDMCSIDDINNSEPIEDFFKMETDTGISHYSGTVLSVIEQVQIENKQEVVSSEIKQEVSALVSSENSQ
jgi:hypothetical protein